VIKVLCWHVCIDQKWHLKINRGITYLCGHMGCAFHTWWNYWFVILTFFPTAMSFPNEWDSCNLEFDREIIKFRPIIANYYSGSDSKKLIGIVSRRCNISRATPILIRWSCDMMNLHRQIQIPHIRHEDNRSADFLANLTLTPSFINTYVLETLVVSFIITYLMTNPEHT
jgi:hypothetical protein